MIKIALNRDDFYESIELMNLAGKVYSDHVICEIDSAIYKENKDDMPTHFKVIEDGNDLIIKEANKDNT